MLRFQSSAVIGMTIFLLMGLLSLVAGAHAADFQEIYQLALKQDATFQAAQHQYLAARETKPQARSFLLPQVTLGAGYERTSEKVKRSSQPTLDSDFNTTTYGLNIGQVLFNRELFISLDQADTSVAQAEAQLEAARQNLIVRVAEAFFNVLAAEDTLRFSEAEKDAIGRQLEQAQKRFEVGLIAITDVKEAQADYDNAVASEIAARNALDIANSALSVLVGQSPGELNKLSERMPLVIPNPENADQWRDKALEQNLQLIATQLSTENARLEIKRARAGHYPTLDLTAGANETDIDGGFFGARDTRDLSIGVELNLPIFSGGLVRSKTREAKAGFDEAQELLTQQRRDTAKQARDAYLNVISGISQVKALRRAVESNQAAAEATQAGFDVGTRTSVDVLIALRNLFSAEREHAIARYNYVVDTLRLKQAAGSLSVKDVSTINRWFD